jgi:hypothetical protein
MIDTALTLAQLNTLFQTLTMTLLGLDPSAPDSAKKVRIAWQQCGAPAWKITDDMVSVRCLEADDPYNRQREVENSRIDDVTLNQATSYTRVNSVTWVFYGPNSYSNAQKVRSGIFYQENRDLLSRSNIYPIPDIVSPRRIPENENAQWWERVDLTISFNELVIENVTEGVITSVDIRFYDERGTVDTQALNDAINSGQISVEVMPSGLIVKSPNGTKWLIVPDNDGNLTATSL